MIRILLSIAIMTILSGCASTYKHSELQAPSEKLDPEKGVLISIPENGWYGNTQYQNSGRMTANAVRAAFSKNSRKTDLDDNCQENDCLKDIDKETYSYYVKPVILHWEERATEWSGKPDRIEIQLIVYDAFSKEELANTSYSGKSKWATFGGDHPQDLLPEPTNEYVKSLYH